MASENQAVEIKPTTEVTPVVETKPAAQVTPAVEIKPVVAEVKPVIAEVKPVVEVKPAVAEVKPVVAEVKPAVEVKPVEIKPVAEVKPAEPTQFDIVADSLKSDEKSEWKYICTCGLSTSLPFCSGAHKNTVYKPLKVKVSEDGKTLSVFPIMLTVNAAKKVEDEKKAEEEKKKASTNSRLLRVLGLFTGLSLLTLVAKRFCKCK